MKKYSMSGLFVVILMFSGCATMLRAVVPDSPRPDKSQIEAAKEMSKDNVNIIAGLQSNKQENMTRVAETALGLLGTSTTQFQAVAITNITGNALKAIENADGTRKTLGALQGRTMEDVLRMPTSQFLAGIAGQTIADVGNKEAIYKGIDAGFQWTKAHTGLAISLATILLGGGVGGKILSNVKGALEEAQQRSSDLSTLNKATAGGIEEWKKDNQAAWLTLKPILASAHSAIPLVVPIELGIKKEVQTNG